VVSGQSDKTVPSRDAGAPLVFAIPTLTAPFVLASRLFLLPRQHFE
jgi:urea transporter